MAVLICLMLLSSAQSATAQVNLVVNGGFDTDASGWTITNVSDGGGYLFFLVIRPVVFIWIILLYPTLPALVKQSRL